MKYIVITTTDNEPGSIRLHSSIQKAVNDMQNRYDWYLHNEPDMAPDEYNKDASKELQDALKDDYDGDYFRESYYLMNYKNGRKTTITIEKLD